MKVVTYTKATITRAVKRNIQSYIKMYDDVSDPLVKGQIDNVIAELTRLEKIIKNVKL